MPAIVCVLALFALWLTAPDARAQENLDRNLTGPKLFATSCATCHKSARGLAKGRVSFLLTYYLRQHYTSSTGSAQVLSAYLQSVDTPPAKTKRAAGKAKPKGVAATAATSRLPAGVIPADRPVRPPAKVQKQ
jgi:mono/diheme cytochrome c family protein